LLAGAPCGGNLLFVDLETTGLAGGAGSYAFLVGCGWFEHGRFHVRQFLLSSFAAERALLEAVSEVAEAKDAVATYNGKSFDLPLIETRFALNRLTTPFAEMPHVDMLHHARRLWHGDQDGHRLSSLETSLLGHEREGDVAGFEIPARYFHYVRTGDARPLAAVLEHNRRDLLSLALLTARAAQLLDEGVTAATTAREALAIGRLYERSGMTSDALACYAKAADMGPGVSAEALYAQAVLLRRARHYAAAADVWQRLLGLEDCPPRLEREAAEALAVHHEHRLRSLLSARNLAMRSLYLDATATRRQAVEHRLARLDRKLARVEPAMPALF
jgi:tetratricopeptide (TPR) repeat protein